MPPRDIQCAALAHPLTRLSQIRGFAPDLMDIEIKGLVLVRRTSVRCGAMVSRLPRNAPAWLDRLSTWLEPFESCFGHVAQRGAFRRYLLGLLSDSRRKSMSAMLARVSDPGTYQAFQHFITDAPWTVAPLWRQLRAVIPDRTGVLILDGTSFPKQGTHSVGVARQYCGTLGKTANCQVAVTAALWTGVRAWMVGARLYLPEEWLTPDQRQRARIPPSVRFQEKWRLAAHAAAAGAREWPDGDRGRRRCRVRQQRARCVGRSIARSCRMRSASRPM